MKPLINPNKPSDWDNPYGYWPDGLHWELLKAIYLEDNADALEKWSKKCDVDTTDDGMLRLLPVLYRRLRADRSDNPVILRAKSKYRFTLYRNHLYLNRLKGLVEKLNDAGIPYVFVKGLALMVQFYRDMGLRPMNDWDIAVPFDRYEEVCGILEKDGLKRLRFMNRPRRYFMRGVEWGDGDYEIDVHWRVLPGFFERDLPGVWERKKEISFKSTTFSVVSPEVNFAMVLINGLDTNPVASIRWVADSIEILDVSGDQFDWDFAFSLIDSKTLGKELTSALKLIKVLRPDLNLPVALDPNFDPCSLENISKFDHTTRSFWGLLKQRLKTYAENSHCESLMTRIYFLPELFRYQFSVKDDLSIIGWFFYRINKYIKKRCRN